MLRARRFPWLAALVLALLLPAAVVRACNIPVFRYALERWTADPYEARVYHQGPLRPAERALEEQLRRATEGSAPANLTVAWLDVAQLPPEARRPATLPWLELRYPAATRIEAPAWEGPLDEAAVARLVGSPARRELTRRILGGESAVWLLLECGRPAEDEAAARLLADELARLGQTLQLPQLTTSPEDQLAPQGPPLRLAFSLLRVARQDPAERVLVSLLLGSEPDLREHDAPMVFPVFGRGRVLYALIGRGITADNTQEAAAYLVAACSCQVKREHPGIDLLLGADWGLPSPAPEPTVLSTPGERVPIPPGRPAVAPAAADAAWPGPLLLGGVAAAAALVLLTGGLAWRSRVSR